MEKDALIKRPFFTAMALIFISSDCAKPFSLFCVIVSVLSTSYPKLTILMKHFLTFLIVVVLFQVGAFSTAIAQPRQGGFISGTVLNSVDRAPIEYATVLLFSQGDSSRVNGVTTNAAGEFRLTPVRPGSYFLQISFLGFLPLAVDNIEMRRGSMRNDLESLMLTPTVLEGGEVTVVGEKSAIEYHLDKKVINVSRQQGVISGTAIDVLEQAPSVSVDIEGNVSLRGSSNFTVLIDGRPSILDPNDALQQIPAGTIESIEIITNPSAKYSPDGTAGIFNVILNKNRAQGINGMVNLNGGLDDKQGGDILLTQRRDKVTLTLAGDYDERHYPGESNSEKWTSQDGTISNVLSAGSMLRGRTRFGLRGEIEWNPTDRNLLSIGARLGGRSGKRITDLNHEEWTGNNPHTEYISRNESERSGDFYSLTAYHRYRIAPKGHEVTTNLQLSTREFDEHANNEQIDTYGSLISGQRSSESGPSRRVNLKLEYLRELAAGKKLEAGYDVRLSRSEDNNKLADYDTLQQAYLSRPDFEHETEYQRNIHAIYATFGDDSRKLSYQLGIRGEYTGRKVELIGEAQEFTIDQWDYFPSAHLSLDLERGRQLMTSYTRRIQRTRGWQLEPFETWSDPYNVRRGNPDLRPRYTDSYEAGFLTDWLGANLSFEVYYRMTHNRVEFIRSVYSDNVTLLTFENVGTDYSLGTEYRINFKPLRVLETDLSGNFYDYRIEGAYADRSFDDHSFSWDSRLKNTVKFGNSLRWQLDANYRSPVITSQGERAGFLTLSTSLRKDFLSNRLTATLQLRDIFGSYRHESTASGADFYDFRKSQFDTPIVMLNVSYKFNNYKAKRNRGRNGDFSDGEEGF
jgi:outer membrane receptor protein involved in Fe transport